MEPIGLLTGVAGLASVFTACIECFEYIQLGRQFGEDYGKCLLKLDTAKVRMSRWGVAMGLGPKLRPQHQILASEQEIRVARTLLEQIRESFDDAEAISERFRKRTSMKNIGSDELLVLDANSDLSSDYQRLHITMRELANRRQKGTSIRKKAKWALYDKKRFDRMIEDVTGFTSELVDLFPAAQEDQKALCNTEVSRVRETQDLRLLKDIACKDDSILAVEVEKEMDSRGHSFTDWKAGGHSKMRAGDENAFGVMRKNHIYTRFEVLDYADVQLGDVNKGK
ncbi:MAG: hypothetical protein LQ338_005715 [Usnochroma carphineum]|nr:MAG: hypothetical protein LQ338_005715 [Usnochroma carphineum]